MFENADFEGKPVQHALHLIHCAGQLAVMYVKEKLHEANEGIDRAMDVWGDEDFWKK